MSASRWTALLSAALLTAAAQLAAEDIEQAPSATPTPGVEALSQFEAATNELANLRVLPPSSKTAEQQLSIANRLLSAGSNELASAEFSAYRSTHGDKYGNEAEALFGEASALLAMGRHEKAATRFREAAKAATNTVFSAQCLVKNAEALKLCKLYETAATAFDDAAAAAEAADMTNAAWRAKWEMATCRELMGDLKAAAEYYSDLAAHASSQDDFDRGMLRSANIRERTGMVDAAMKNYESVLASSSSSNSLSAAFAGLGRCNFNSGNYSNAIGNCDDAIAHDPGNTAATFLKAMTLYAVSRDSEAEKIVQDFLAVHTNATAAADLKLWLAKLDFNNGKTERAASGFASFAENSQEHPEAPNALLWAAYSFFETGNYVSCSDMVGLLAVRYPKSQATPEARIIQAKALCNMARYDEALLVVNDVQTRFPASEYAIEAMLLRGDILYTLSASDPSRVETSIGIYEKILARSDIPAEYVTICSNRISRATARRNRMREQAR